MSKLLVVKGGSEDVGTPATRGTWAASSTWSSATLLVRTFLKVLAVIALVLLAVAVNQGIDPILDKLTGG